MDLSEVTEKITRKIEQNPGLKARVLFDFGDDGCVFADTTADPVVITNTAPADDPDCTLACSIETFAGFLTGSGDPNIAFMMGRLKVRGSMGLALKLNALLES